MWEQQSLGYITNFDGNLQLNPRQLANIFRDMVCEEGAPADKSTYTEAIDRMKATERLSIEPYTRPTFGYVIQCASELSSPQLEGLLKYADENLKPTWENGGLFYERNDEPYDEGCCQPCIHPALHSC